MVQQKVVTLLSDPENIVKQSLMENGITRLCVFFGRQKANDVLLSHMITFLNDKNDWHLRGGFFDSIVGQWGLGAGLQGQGLRGGASGAGHGLSEAPGFGAGGEHPGLGFGANTRSRTLFKDAR